MSWTVSKSLFDFAWGKEVELHANHAKLYMLAETLSFNKKCLPSSKKNK